MRSASILAFAATAISSANSFSFGFNVGAQVNGHCRSEQEWEFAFNKLASFPGNTKSVRLYAASDCNTLANAVPAAVKTGTQLLVGIWTQDDLHFEAEKQALLQAIQQYGKDWILAVSVGSEDLYRKEAPASTIAAKINDVRGMMWGMGASDKTIGMLENRSRNLMYQDSNTTS